MMQKVRYNKNITQKSIQFQKLFHFLFAEIFSTFPHGTYALSVIKNLQYIWKEPHNNCKQV